MIDYTDFFKALTDKNITYYIFKKNKISQSTFTKLKENDGSISMNSLEQVCDLANISRLEFVKTETGYKILVPNETSPEQGETENEKG